jgi:hypothetical protein
MAIQQTQERTSLKGNLLNSVLNWSWLRGNENKPSKPPSKPKTPMPEKPATVQPPRLAAEPDILDRLDTELNAAGVVGDSRAAKLVYLVLTSRFLDRPLCAVIKGQSSAGKSHVINCVLSLFSPSAAYSLTGMSEHALVYSEEPLSYRILVIAEASGLQSRQVAYMVRSLISEGRVKYETAGKGGREPRVIEREGPTGLLITTTNLTLDAELETRLLSIPINDSPIRTSAVMHAIAAEYSGNGGHQPVDPAPWFQLHEWLAEWRHDVIVPFAEKLADAIPPVDVRLNRDLRQLLTLIQTHALLHQVNRDRDEQGRIIATEDDYAAVYPLVKDIFSAGTAATVPLEMRETVEAVRFLKKSRNFVSQQDIVKHLKLDKSNVSRRVTEAIRLGYLVNAEKGKGKPSKLDLGNPLPDEVALLPSPEQLRKLLEKKGREQ